MSMFHQIETNDAINKVYQPPYPSGASTLPYSYGWSNKYSPKPFGLRVYSDIYSAYAQTGLQNSGTRDLINNAPLFGPLNSVYEVEVSGIQNNGHCINCTDLNRKYLVYFPKYLFNGSDIRSVPLNQPTTDNAWFGYACNSGHPTNLCGINQVGLMLGTSDNTGALTTGSLSGIVNLKFVLYRTNGIYHAGGIVNIYTTGNIVFNKSFGYIESLNPSYNNKKPYMMEGEHVLTANPDGNYKFQWGDIGGYLGDNQSAMLSCNSSGAIAIVRPYKFSFYDIKSASMAFISGQYVPSVGPIEDNGNVPPDFQYYQWGDLGRSNYTCDNFYKNHPDYLKLITSRYDRGAPSGYVYKFYPSMIELTINGLSNSKFRNDCRDCNEYYSKPKNLTLGYDNFTNFGNGIQSINTRIYTWSGTTNLDANIDGNQLKYFNYYNICDHGCNSVGFLSNRKNNFTQGLCSNLIQLSIETSSVLGTDAWRMIGRMSFGGTYYSGTAFQSTKYSPYILKKVLCDDTGPVKCTTGGSAAGAVNCFSQSFFDGGWTKELNDEPFSSGFGNMPSYLDAFTACGIESGILNLRPYSTAQTPCARWRCNIVDGYKVPQTATITLNVHPSSLAGFGTRTMIAPIVGGTCWWKYSNKVNGLPNTVGWDSEIINEEYSRLNFETLGTVSKGYVIFDFSSKIISTVNSGTYYASLYVSGLNIGDLSVSGLSHISGSSLIYLRGPTGAIASIGPYPGINDFTYEIEFTDLYDIRDYL